MRWHFALRQLASLVFSPWDATLQLFKPVEHNVDLRRALLLGFSRFYHQETPAVARHVEVWACRRRREESSLKQYVGFAGGEHRLADNIHCQHLISTAIKELPPVGIPHRFGSTVR